MPNIHKTEHTKRAKRHSFDWPGLASTPTQLPSSEAQIEPALFAISIASCAPDPQKIMADPPLQQMAVTLFNLTLVM